MRFRRSLLTFLVGVPLAAASVSAVWAQDPPQIVIQFLGDRFEPAQVNVPQGVKVALRIENKSTVAMEWESHALHREKIVAAGSAATITVGPLKPGSYEFFDEFHPKIRGNLVVR